MIKLNLKDILEYQQNRPPYLMIDCAEKIVPGKSSLGYKYFKDDEWFFKVHWKNDPNVPGMLQIEALTQMASLSILTLDGNKGKVMYLANANKLKFLKKITPNSKFVIETSVISYKRGLAKFSASGKINNDLACSAEFTLIMPEELMKYNLKK
jgi:3-hydroxyacyl-[acyl-carrier-protein] dehydratase